MRLTEKLVFPHGNDESAPSILMGWRAAATSFEPQLALPPVATRNGPAQPMRIGAGTASEETAKLEASGWGWVHRCFRSIKFPPEIPEEPYCISSFPCALFSDKKKCPRSTDTFEHLCAYKNAVKQFLVFVTPIIFRISESKLKVGYSNHFFGASSGISG